MSLNELLKDSVYFGMILSLATYQIGYGIQKKYKKIYLNPLLISIVLIISFLAFAEIEFETYKMGAKYLSYFLTPVTVCLAVPLYKQLQVLKDNFIAIVISILSGCISHAAVLIFLAILCKVDNTILLSLFPKSITTAIALGVTEEIGGIAGISVAGIMIAGVGGAVVGPSWLSFLRITDPVAQGLAMGSASHAIGTSKAVEMGEIQAAMSSLAIVVNGILTVIIVPWVVQLIS